MKMAEAKQKLMELANGEFHSISYELSDHGKGRCEQTCKVYLANHGWFDGKHWEVALMQLERAMNHGAEGKITEDLPISKPEKAKSK